jgi:cell division septation protein DedD
MFPSENNESLDRKFEKLEDKIERLAEKPKTDNIEKAVEVIGKIFEKAQGNQPQQAQRHPLDNLAIEYVIKDVQNAKQHGGEANEYTLKDTEMRNLHDIEMKKLGWEIAKYEKGESTTERVLETIKAVMAGPIGEAVKSLGNSAARRIEGHGTIPKVVSANCPRCQKSFNVVEGSRQVVCPHCSAVLQLNQPSQPPPEQPQPQPQEPQPQVPSAETPQTETPQAQPQETLSEPKKPDVLTDF